MHPTPSAIARSINRRQFLAGTGATAVGFAASSPAILHAADSEPKVTFGLLGCGGRGSWIAKLFQRNGNFQCTAVHDYFPDRADNAAKDLGVPENARFTGLNGYKKLLEQKVDAVVIQSPPYFHPIQAAEAVAAGKHVYMAKPTAVDVPGCHTVMESGTKATTSRRVFYVDFQTRAMPDYQKAVQLVQGGMIGKISLAEATYHCGNTFDSQNEALRKSPNDPELRLRAWGLDKDFSGDVITEQNIHALDVASWVLNAEPVKAYGTCAHNRGFAGTCHDTWAVIFYYPGGVLCSFNSKQFGHGYDDILCRVYGTNGTLDTHYGGKVSIRSSDDGFNGNSPNIYETGAVNNIASFHYAITTGDFSNPTVAPSVRSNFTTLLGRTAAYRNGEFTWAELIRMNERIQIDLKGLKA